ncbi:MAG: hypothetical protein FWH23_03615 [Bacteroidales bacterium]|nr:hypothetical protein [Bacteroidales bacterium]
MDEQYKRPEFKVSYIKKELTSNFCDKNARSSSLFGAPIAALSWSNQTQNKNRYLREGKEYVSDHGWNKYDYHARAFCSWSIHPLQLDPMAEMFYHLSPYALWANNPVNAIDPDGRVVWVLPLIPAIKSLLIATGITTTAYVAHKAARDANIGQAISGALRDAGNAIGEVFSSPNSVATSRVEEGRVAADNTQVQTRIPLSDVVVKENRAATREQKNNQQRDDRIKQGKADEARGNVQNAADNSGYGQRPPGGDPEPKNKVVTTIGKITLGGGVSALGIYQIFGNSDIQQVQEQMQQQQQQQQQEQQQQQSLWERLKSLFTD